MKHAKTLGLAVMAVLALAAFTGVASASAAEFHASVGGTALSGAQTKEHVFTVQGSEVKCTTAKFTGTAAASGKSPTQSMHPEYSGCTGFGFPATVATAGCLYNFHATGGTVDLEGCTGGVVTITVSVTGVAKCIVQIANQTGINGQTYVNQTGRKTLVVETNSTNILANVTTSTGSCPLKVATGATSTYTGITSVAPASGELWVE